MKTRNFTAFSLIEVVIALGIFTFCVTILLGLIPIGLKAARSVTEESNAVHIASSIFGFWQQAPTGVPLVIPGVFSNASMQVGVVGVAPDNYFGDSGSPTDAASASLRMSYAATALPGVPNGFSVELRFQWPARAPSSSPALQSRIFKEVFAK